MLRVRRLHTKWLPNAASDDGGSDDRGRNKLTDSGTDWHHWHSNAASDGRTDAASDVRLLSLQFYANSWLRHGLRPPRHVRLHQLSLRYIAVRMLRRLRVRDRRVRPVHAGANQLADSAPNRGTRCASDGGANAATDDGGSDRWRLHRQSRHVGCWQRRL